MQTHLLKTCWWFLKSNFHHKGKTGERKWRPCCFLLLQPRPCWVVCLCSELKLPQNKASRQHPRKRIAMQMLDYMRQCVGWFHSITIWALEKYLEASFLLKICQFLVRSEKVTWWLSNYFCCHEDCFDDNMSSLCLQPVPKALIVMPLDLDSCSCQSEWNEAWIPLLYSAAFGVVF